MTAWEGLVDRAHVRAGQRVLVLGGSGGVGHMAVQIARSFGAAVFATASASHAEYITSLGATPIYHRVDTINPVISRPPAGLGFAIVYYPDGERTRFVSGNILSVSLVRCCSRYIKQI